MEPALAAWAGRRVFVTGASGFLGGALVRSLVAADADVVALIRHPNRAGQFFAEQLYNQVHIVRGDVTDDARLRLLLAACEPTVIFHLAGVGLNGLLNAMPSGCRVVAPMPAQSLPSWTGSRPPITLLLLPTLFGPHDHRASSAVASAFTAAVSQRPVPSLLAGDYLCAADAAELLLAQLAQDTPNELRLPGQGTATELFQLLSARPVQLRLRSHSSQGRRSLAEAVAGTLAWFARTVPAPQNARQAA